MIKVIAFVWFKTHWVNIKNRRKRNIKIKKCIPYKTSALTLWSLLYKPIKQYHRTKIKVYTIIIQIVRLPNFPHRVYFCDVCRIAFASMGISRLHDVNCRRKSSRIVPTDNSKFWLLLLLLLRFWHWPQSEYTPWLLAHG